MERVEIEKNEIKREEDEEKSKEKRKEEENNKKSENEDKSVRKDLSYPPIPEKKNKKGCFFNKLLPKNYFWPKKKSLFEKGRRKMCCFEERDIKPEAGSNTLIQKDFLKKFKDPGSFNLLVAIRALFVGKALLDLGESINLIPLMMLR